MSINQGFLKPGIPGSAPVKLVCVGLSKIQTSPDGINWTLRTAPATMQYNAVCYSPSLNLYVACGNSNSSGAGNSFATSPDGVTWTSRTGPQAANWSSVAWSPTLAMFAAVCQDSVSKTFAIATSTDGITWTGVTGLTGTWTSICYYAHQPNFIAVSTGGANKIMKSSDGVTWTSSAEPASTVESWTCVAVHESGASSLVVALSSTADGKSMSSVNVTTWTQRACRTQATAAVCFFPPAGIFLAVGSSFAAPSTKLDQQGDTTWSDGSLVATSGWCGICYSASLGLAVACSQSASNRIATTTNGAAWTLRTDSANGTWFGICASA